MKTSTSLALLVCLSLAVLLLSSCTVNASLFGERHGPLSEVTVESEGTAKALLISVEGAITSEDSRSLFGGSGNTVDEIRRQLKKAAHEESGIKAVILRVNSPGGGATASDTIYHELKSFREKTGIPIVAFFQDVAASGGYYISMAADEIVAQPTSITGSIGVIAVFMDATGLMDKIGVKAHVVRSSDFKASGHPLIEKSEADLQQARTVISQMQEQFIGVVTSGRKNLTPESVRKASDGQVHMGAAAKELGLVDHIGYFEAARDRAAALAGVSKVKVVTYSTVQNDTGRTVYTAPSVSESGQTPSISIDVARQLGLTNGTSRFLYYWAP